MSDRQFGDCSDAELLRRVRAEPDAFGFLYDRHAGAVLAYCARRTGCAQTAADLTGEVFAAAYARRGDFRDEGVPAQAWLFGIARRQIGTFLRRQRVSDRYRRRFGFGDVQVSADETERIEAEIMSDSLRTALCDALSSLSRAQADALRLRVVDELAYRDVAAVLGCSEGAARVRVSRALVRLAALLEAP